MEQEEWQLTSAPACTDQLGQSKNTLSKSASSASPDERAVLVPTTWALRALSMVESIPTQALMSVSAMVGKKEIIDASALSLP